MADEPDPNDVAGLESSLNDSATRVSTLWISYLLFGLYLLVAAGTATHRQLLLEEPLKLPALGSDVPLVWFFLVSPALFVLLHFYVLLQVLLLGRTAQAYDRALNLILPVRSENYRFRERLANTLFAQFFAGAPRERLGWIGRIIRAIAWITLIGGPIYLIFTFQLAFLPYHSPLVTWTHRTLICVEVAIAIVFGPIVTDPRKDLNWRRLVNRTRRAVEFPTRFFIASIDEKLMLRQQLYHYLIPTAYLLLILVSWLLITFPGEAHLNGITFQARNSVTCERYLSFAKNFDRLNLANVSVVDPEKIAKWNEDIPRGQHAYDGARSKNLKGRDLNCSTFTYADLRRVDLARAHLLGSNLEYARLEGASMQKAILDDAILSFAYMNEVDLHGASLLRATLDHAILDNSPLSSALLQGADFSLASLIGVDLRYVTTMQGANFVEADLRGARLTGAHLEGASLQRAKLDGANLAGAVLFGADLESAQLQAADLSPPKDDDKAKADFSMARLRKTWLNLSDLGNANFEDALISEAFLWGTKNIDCSKAFVWKPDFSEVIRPVPDDDPREAQPSGAQSVRATQETLSKLTYDLEYTISRSALDRIRVRIKEAKDSPPNPNCSDNSATHPFDETAFANRLADRICNPSTAYIRDNRGNVAAGLIRNALPDAQSDQPKSPAYIATLATRLLKCMPDEISQHDHDTLSGMQQPARDQGTEKPQTKRS
jgi:uncharacterized protein YjbI with pentapeptide repeats